MRSRADNRPWRPVTPGTPHAPYAVQEPVDHFVPFSVVELASQELAGEAVLWAIDHHNRTAHLGISLRPAFRGRGLGTDVVRTLCGYGFEVRGLRRLQLETLADNAAMIAAAEAVGFRREGTLRRASWVYGQELDEAVFGLLHDEWAPPPAPADRGA
nr:GNAT family protein [Streptomyces sp. SID4948]